MKFTAKQIADLLGGQIEGNPKTIITGLSKIELAGKNDLAFLANLQYADYIYTTKASIVLVSTDFTPAKPIGKNCTLIRVDDPRMSFAKLLETYHEFRHAKSGISDRTYISDTATTGKNVYIGPNCYIGDYATIGDDVKIYPNCFIGDYAKIGDKTLLYAGVKISFECEVGKSCTIHSGAVIGSDGFGFVPTSNKDYKKMVQTGNVVIGDRAEIGANTTIDRATMGSTIIHNGVKLDNLIQIAHNVVIGENTVIAAQTGIAGSTTIGKNCMIGGQVGIIGHLTIADEVKIAAQSGIGQSITKKGEIVQGSPAFPIGEYRRSYVLFRNLPNLAKKINDFITHSKE